MYRSQLVPRDIECLCKPISCDDPLKMATRGDDFSRACLAKGRLKFPKASKMSTDYSVFLLMQLLLRVHFTPNGWLHFEWYLTTKLCKQALSIYLCSEIQPACILFQVLSVKYVIAYRIFLFHVLLRTLTWVCHISILFSLTKPEDRGKTISVPTEERRWLIDTGWTLAESQKWWRRQIKSSRY